MNKKNIVVSSLVVFFCAMFFASMAYADRGYKDGHHKYGLDKKVLKKFHLILTHKDDLGLSDEQVKKIKGLKIKTKKNLIKQKAEIDLIKIDIKSSLWEDKIDIKTIEKLIDQKYEIKKEKAKALINSYAELKNILSDEQKAKLKSISLNKRKMK